MACVCVRARVCVHAPADSGVSVRLVIADERGLGIQSWVRTLTVEVWISLVDEVRVSNVHQAGALAA